MTTKGVEATMGDIGNLDRQIEILMDCKPLSETEVKQLCEKVRVYPSPHSTSPSTMFLLFSKKNLNDLIISLGQGDSNLRVKRATSQSTCDHLW